MSEEIKPEEKKGMSWKTALFWALPVAAIILLGIAFYASRESAKVNPFENKTIAPLPNLTLVEDITVPMCNALNEANQAANITRTKYYLSDKYCVWEVIGYDSEFYIHCENAEQKAEIIMRPINMTVDEIQSKFTECQVLPIVRDGGVV